MMGPTSGISVVNEVLRELKLDHEEDQKIYREQANSNFDQKIAELQSQVQILKDQASKIGSMGIFNFIVNIVTSVLTAIASFLGPMASQAAQIAVKVIGIVKDALTTVQKFLNDLTEKEKVESQAKLKESEISADTFEKFYNDYHTQEQEARQQANEVMQTMRQVRRDTTEAHSSMAKI